MPVKVKPERHKCGHGMIDMQACHGPCSNCGSSMDYSDWCVKTVKNLKTCAAQ